MPDPDSSPPSQTVKRPHDYPIGTSSATPLERGGPCPHLADSPPTPSALAAVLRERIERDGPLDFPDFMEAALYDPQLGYYARATSQVGRRGDFFTSVSVGPLFGRVLARRLLREWRNAGGPARWRIIE